MTGRRGLRVEAVAIAGVKGMIRAEEKERDKKAQEEGETKEMVKVKAKDALSQLRQVQLPGLQVVFLLASVANRALAVPAAVSYDTISRSTLSRIAM